MRKPPEAVRRWTSMKNPIAQNWIIRYIDGEMWTTGGTIEEAEEKAREHHDAEIAAIA